MKQKNKILLGAFIMIGSMILLWVNQVALLPDSVCSKFKRDALDPLYRFCPPGCYFTVRPLPPGIFADPGPECTGWGAFSND